jgi:translation initiation factor 1 (eIF-1/SUI1)
MVESLSDYRPSSEFVPRVLHRLRTAYGTSIIAYFPPNNGSQLISIWSAQGTKSAQLKGLCFDRCYRRLCTNHKYLQFLDLEREGCFHTLTPANGVQAIYWFGSSVHLVGTLEESRRKASSAIMSKNRMTIGDFLPPPQRQQQQQQQQQPSAVAAPNIKSPNMQNAPTTPYGIRATKKGGVPCVVESRKHHKVVTLSNIEGDVGALLSALQKALGTGGVRKGDSVIEVQGEHHLETIRSFCLKSGCVAGATKQSKAEATAAAAAKQKQKQTSKGKANPTENNSSKASATKAISSTAGLSQKEIKAMKPETLKKHLAARDLSIQGNKKELVARLTEASTSIGSM